MVRAKFIYYFDPLGKPFRILSKGKYVREFLCTDFRCLDDRIAFPLNQLEFEVLTCLQYSTLGPDRFLIRTHTHAYPAY